MRIKDGRGHKTANRRASCTHFPPLRKIHCEAYLKQHAPPLPLILKKVNMNGRERQIWEQEKHGKSRSLLRWYWQVTARRGHCTSCRTSKPVLDLPTLFFSQTQGCHFHAIESSPCKGRRPCILPCFQNLEKHSRYFHHTHRSSMPPCSRHNLTASEQDSSSAPWFRGGSHNDFSHDAAVPRERSWVSWLEAFVKAEWDLLVLVFIAHGSVRIGQSTHVVVWRIYIQIKEQRCHPLCWCKLWFHDISPREPSLIHSSFTTFPRDFGVAAANVLESFQAEIMSMSLEFSCPCARYQNLYW